MSRELELLTQADDEDGAARTFTAVLDAIARAERVIRIHMFVWRNDAIGRQIGQAVLDAARRGVQVSIKKDLSAYMYECIEMNRKPLLATPVSWRTKLYYRIIRPSFPDTYAPDDNDDELGGAMLGDPNIHVEWVDNTHSKYYLVDDAELITGSINIEDRHRGYYDYMVRLTDKALVERFSERLAGRVPCDATRAVEFVFNHEAAAGGGFEIKPLMMDLLDGAESSVYIEMAYVGDRDISRKLVEISRRGVQVTMLFSKEANVGNDINFRTIAQIHRDGEVDIYLTPKMIHSKLMLVDDAVAFFGSANFSVFSMQKGVEFNLLVRDHPEFLGQLRQTIAARIAASARVESNNQLTGYNRVVAALQQLHQKLFY